MPVAALFVDLKGPYPEIVGRNQCWDESRDARKYAGVDPVVAHPPCGRWCAMARLNERRWGARVGDDGNCFLYALSALIRCGGVLEHPAGSIAWGRFGLKRPLEGWTEHQYGKRSVWVCEVWQSAYGHMAHKRTWLAYAGDRAPFELIWKRDKSLATAQIGGGINTGNRNLPRLNEALTHITPVKFALELVTLAFYSRGQ